MEGMRGLLPGWIKTAYRSLRTQWLSLGLGSRQNFSLSEAERNASSAISVVIAIHDSPEVTRRCLKSLECYGGESEIILVDDGSKLESTKRMLGDVCSRNRWRLIGNDRAFGHSRACEAGIAVTTRPYLCLLNSDTIVTQRSWLGIVQAFESSPKIAVVGPSTSQTVTAQVVPRALYCRHLWSDEQISCFAEKYVSRHRQEPVVDLPKVGGFAFFVRRAIWQRMGGFDKNLPDYGNELEFCERAINLKFRVVWSKASYIHHLGSESYGRTLGFAEIKKRGLDAVVYVQKKWDQ